ncbi:E3 ubiquitin-protein ligase RNF10-like [Lineus longissimus]|uniref:E3 ubiquitin-protein ligase RNF10-like n=1 Tax=Lineus longissimus TaxID=88925 RepID=UPI002B4D0EE7
MQREEETMERSQGNRPSAVQQKCGVTDIRKSDYGHQRFPRAGKKREQQASKSDQYNNGKKPVPQRDRAIDKRPKPRGYDNYRERDEVAEGNRAEIGSALQQGSKKANLNHLLNFTFAPREKEGGGWKGRNKWTRSSRVTYNKEQFLQANCQFIVRDTGDYMSHATCPDRLVDWDLLEQVRIFGHGVPSCPICLFPPTAAKITRCGHIYCWVCILHYLSLGDKPWRKCPICYESIVKKDLKSVVSLDTHQFSIGEEITMKLMKKEKGSVLVLPKNQWTAGNLKPFPVDADVDTYFSKLLVASVDQVQADIIKTEKQALLQQKEECWDSLEGSFVELALADLAEREESLVATARAKEELADVMSAVDLAETEDVLLQAELPAGITPLKAGIIYTSAFSDEEEDPPDGDNPPSPKAAERARKDSTMSTESVDSATGLVPLPSIGASGDCSSPTPEEEASALLELPSDREEKTAKAQDSAQAFYFYQAADGQHVYMHSINARCLLKQYGSLEHCPDTITARIEALEGISMTQELRQRLRYLNHLPLTCEFRVAELRLKPPLVSRDTLAHFQAEFDKRRHERQRKARDERRMSKMIEKQEKKQLEPYMNTKIVYSEQAESVIIPSAAPLSPDLIVDSPPSVEILSDSPTSQGSVDDPSAPVSFAQMLRAGKAKPDAWPKLPPKNGAPVEPVPKPVARLRHGSESQSEGEDHVPIPTYQSSFGDAIRAALDTIEGDRSNRDDNEVTMETSSPTAQQSGKKKKMKKKLLFSTTMNRTK